jgi:hypothetical protein
VLGGIFFLTRERPLPGAFLLGLAVIAHKATWPVAGLVFLGYLISVRSKLSLKTVGAGLLLIGPLGLIWLLGLARHGDALWILTSNLETELAPRGSFPVLDGILGAFAGGGMAGMFKGLVVLGFAGLALGLLVGVWTQANLPYRTLWLGLGVAVLALFLVLNRYEIWAAVRFSRLLAVPLVLALPPVWQRLPGKKLLLAGAGCLALITQAAYAWYMARVFFD